MVTSANPIPQSAVPESELNSTFRIANPRRVCCMGAGYVGVPTMVMLALKCPSVEVIVVDVNSERIAAWNSSNLPLYEPGLWETLSLCRGRNLFFSDDIPAAIKYCDIIFVCVNTPTKTNGFGAGRACDLGPWELAGRAIAKHSESNKIVVEKSTVPVRTAEALETVLTTSTIASFVILSNPEFLAEGSAMRDLEFPDRVLIGAPPGLAGKYAISTLITSVYSGWIPRSKILTTNLWSAELSKLVSNAFLAQRVSSINAISLLCERTGADVLEVARAVGTDSRIGGKFLTPSLGFGGSCFQKDLLCLTYLCDQFGLPSVAAYWNQVLLMNEVRKAEFTKTVISTMFGTVAGKRIAVLGFAFKKDTCDTRESPAISVCQQLIDEGADIHVYDPQVKSCPNLNLSFHPEPVTAVAGSHAILVLTEWDEFRSLPFEQFFAQMQKPAFVFDGRNLLDHKLLRQIGFTVRAVGKPVEGLTQRCAAGGG